MIIVNGRFLLQPVTGVQRVEREILAALDDMASNGEIAAPVVLLPTNGEIIAAPNLKSIELKRVGRLSGHLWEQLELPFFCEGATLLCLGNTAPVWALFSNKTRVVSMIHDLSYRYFPTAYSLQFRLLYSALIPLALRKSDHIVTVSSSEKNSIERHYPFLKESTRLQVAQNGGLPDSLAERICSEVLPEHEAREYGIYVGSLSRRKNADGILRAAVQFLYDFPEMRFVIIGATSSVFEAFSIDIPSDVAERLEMRGQVNDPAVVYEAFRHARFLLFPSFYEASPLPPIEAMTLGCPVISSNIPSLVERCGDCSIYCDPHNLDSVTSAIRRLMEDQNLWENYSRLGREKASTYSWRAQTKILLGLCSEG